MDILLFTPAQQLDLFKITAAVMHWGNQKWQQKPREEQAEADGTEHVEKVAKLLGMEIDSFVNGFSPNKCLSTVSPNPDTILFLSKGKNIYVNSATSNVIVIISDKSLNVSLDVKTNTDDCGP
jgi:hypothetical protein